MSLDAAKFHGTAITLTSHITLSLDVPEEYPIQLPDDYAVVHYIDEHAGDVTLSPTEKSASPNFTEIPRSGTPEEAWLKHTHTVLFEEDEELQEMPVTYSGFFSYGQQAQHVRPRATVVFFLSFMRRRHHWPCRNTSCSFLRRQLTL